MPDRLWLAGAAHLAALAVVSAAHAQPNVSVTYQPIDGTITRSVSVETRDLRLSTAEGRARLDHRIMVAARQACGYEGMYGLRQSGDYKRCFAKARNEAMMAD